LQPTGETDKEKELKHNAQIFFQFETLSLAAPHKVGDVEATLTQITEKKVKQTNPSLFIFIYFIHSFIYFIRLFISFIYFIHSFVYLFISFIYLYLYFSISFSKQKSIGIPRKEGSGNEGEAKD
jgi:hypothetical protein